MSKFSKCKLVLIQDGRTFILRRGVKISHRDIDHALRVWPYSEKDLFRIAYLIWTMIRDHFTSNVTYRVRKGSYVFGKAEMYGKKFELLIAAED